MVGSLILLYVTYIVITSWIFWMVVGTVLAFVGFVVSPTFRAFIVLLISLGLLGLWRSFT